MMVDLPGSNPTPDVKELLKRLGYLQNIIDILINHLNTLTGEIDFDGIKERYIRATAGKDTTGLIGLLKDLMISLENKGYYRPDFPVPLIILLVNGLNHKNEDIFSVIAHSELSRKEKLLLFRYSFF